MEKPQHVGRVARQATLQRGVDKVVTKSCTPWTKMTVETLKKQLTMRKMCKHGVCKKKVKMSSGKRWSADETNRI